MDGFPTLPIEISRLILTDAVKVRGIKRAARLQFVSQSWNHEVAEAIVKSGILDGLDRVHLSPFWPNYLTFKIMRKRTTPLSRQLSIIRQVAERVLAFRGESEGDSSNDDGALRQYVFEICQLPPGINRCRPRYRPWLEVPEPIESIDNSDEDFKEALLAVAASMNNIPLVKQLLPSMQDCPQLVAQHGSHEHDPMLGWATDIAAYKGNVEVMRMLLSTLKEPSHLEEARDDAAEYAGQSSQMGILDLCLDPTYTSHNPSLIEVVLETTSIEIFDRVFPLCKDYSIDDERKARHPHPEKLPGKLLARCFYRAVMHGDLAMVRHLVQDFGVLSLDVLEGNKMYSYTALVSEAAEGGHTDVLAYLLENGVTTGSQSLDAACKHGNTGCVRLLLEFSAMDEFKPGSALLESVKRDNDAVVRLLMELGITALNSNMKVKALDIAEKEGLVSMAKIIREYG